MRRLQQAAAAQNGVSGARQTTFNGFNGSSAWLCRDSNYAARWPDLGIPSPVPSRILLLVETVETEQSGDPETPHPRSRPPHGSTSGDDSTTKTLCRA
ncbi:hypothetical protein J3458_005697 [Metarhizium acridum]|uniref:uncharacterized protein n=1 Tax=Metarhizium acridum TaxID=92637 RepID=UPI001C6C14BD|nr:hypothetical protein J3458_005697 [Metarhizium acridum]